MSAIQKHKWMYALMITTSVAFSVNAQTVTYLHTDALGSVVAESDSGANVTRRVAHEPYGGVVGGSVQDGPGYTGHVSDSATGLTYMQQRYYDPQLGMFLSSDPISAYDKPVGQFHRYRYANNNPYTNTDPDGRECNESGCWVAADERKAADAGDWKGYYEKAGSSGDGYARRAGEVASNTGATLLNARLSAATNKILFDSIAIKMGADPQKLTVTQRIAIEFKMEGIRVGLARAHVKALDDAGATAANPQRLDRSVIGEFHKDVFRRNGASPEAFGGFKVDAAESVMNIIGGTTRDIYDYCPQPSCAN